MRDFIAIDFETANECASSVCSIGAVLVKDGEIVGFGNMDESGYLDMLYVHSEHQREGIATAICDMLEEHCPADEFTTHASITAKPFFEQRGYRVTKKQQVECRGVMMTNFVMEKGR